MERYINNADLESKDDLEAIIPYIARSIKDSITSYTSTREDVKYQKIKYSLSGTKYGLEKIIKNIIYNILRSPDIQIRYKSVFNTTSVKDIVTQLTVRINEYYDISQDYYDNDSVQSTTLRDRFQSQVFNRDILHDLDNALTTLDSQKTTLSDDTETEIVTGALSPLLISDTISKKDPQYTQQDYINYNITDNDNTNYQTIKSLVESSIGCDQWKLAVDDTGSYNLSKIISHQDNQNHLNIYYPTINYIPSDDHLIEQKELGIFGMPENVALQRYYSHDITPIVLTEKLTPSTVYILPDINVYGSIYNNTVSGFDNPIDHLEDLNWVKSGIYNYGKAGQILNSKNHNKFFGYISTHETQNYHERGPSRSTDKYDFWTGDRDDIWAQSDVFPIENPYNIDYESRIESMIPITINGDLASSLEANRHDTVTKYSVDIFGNEWFLLKQTDTYDRSSRDKLDVEISTEGGQIECVTSGGEDFTVDMSTDTTTIEGGELSATDYMPQKILTDWISNIDGIQCEEPVTLTQITNCYHIDGIFFNISNIPEEYTWHSELFTVAQSGNISGGHFTDIGCDIQPDTTKDDIYDIDSKLSLFNLDDDYYNSVLMVGTSADNVRNDVYSKQNKILGDVWCREASTGKLEKKFTGVTVDIDVQHDILVCQQPATAKFYRIQNDWTGNMPSLAEI